jgi:hypothetical protein
MNRPITLDELVSNQEVLEKEYKEEEYQRPLNPFSEVETIKAQELGYILDTDETEIRLSRSQGDFLHTTSAKLKQENYNYENLVEKAYEDDKSAEETAQIVQERVEKDRDIPMSEYMLMQTLMLNDSDVTPFASRALTNMETFNRLMQEEFEANDQSGFSKFLHFLDVNLLRELTIGLPENLTYRTNREGTDIREAFINLTPNDFEEWAKEYIEERKDEGIFTANGDSVWNLYKAANDATYLGDDPYAHLNFLFGIADLATLGYVGGIRKTASALKSTTSLAQDTTGKLLSLTQVKRPVDAVAVIDGEDVAANLATRAVEKVGVQTDNITAGRLVPEEMDVASGPAARPAGPAVREGSRSSILYEKLAELNKKGSFGELVPSAVIETTAKSLAARVSETTNDAIANIKSVVDELSDDYKVVIRIGKNGTGAAFRRKIDAEAVASQDPAFKVVRREEGRGWFVETEQRIDVLGLPEAEQILQKSNFIFDTMEKIFGASTTRLSDRLGTLFLQAEAGAANIKQLIRPYEKKINKLGKEETKRLAALMSSFRDGPKAADYKIQAPTTLQFEAEYYSAVGVPAPKQTVEAYEALVDISNTSWQIKSSAMLKRFVQAGGVFAPNIDEIGRIVYKVDGQTVKVPEDAAILDLKRMNTNNAGGASLSKADLAKKQYENVPVYKLDDPFLGHVYVTNVDEIRVLEKVDVMPYNFGGPRANSDLRWFVSAIVEKAVKTVNGPKNASLGIRTLLGAFGKSEAELAVKQINNITEKTRALMDAVGVDDISKLQLGKTDADALSDVIRANRDWNKNISELSDLQLIASKHGFTFREKFAVKARDEKLRLEEVGENPALLGTGMGDYNSIKINMNRGDTPPMQFGGAEAANVNPIEAIADQFNSEAFGYAHRSATQNALVGWVKLAEANPSIVEIPTNIPKNDFLQKLLKAEVTKTGKFNDLAAQLREQQAVIKRRLNQPTLTSAMWESFTRSATESIFDLTGKKSILGWRMEGSDPSSQLLKVGFYSKFGFLNPDQLFLQGFHSVVIAAASPRAGTRGLALAPALSIMTHPSLSKEAKKLAIERLGNSTFGKTIIGKEDLDDLLEYIETSGRANIDNQVAELQTPEKFGVATNLPMKGVNSASSLLDKSTLFFKHGELISRMTAIATAFLEHKATRPNIPANSAKGRAMITKREQDLTYRMTSASRSYFQSGPMRVPTQWLTYMFRSMSAVTIGREFTFGEKLRMFTVLGPVLGMTGLGAKNTAGYITEKMGFDAKDPVTEKIHNTIKYGLIDRLLSEIVGEETAYAKRVSPTDQMKDTLKKLFSEDFMTVVGGPSAEITGDMVTLATRGISNMFAGRTTLAREDLNQVLRNVSSYDKMYKIWELIDTGNYRGRTRKLVSSDVERFSGAASILFGATPAPVQNYYDYKEMEFKKNNKVDEVEKYLRERANYGIRLMIEGDKDDFKKGAAIMQEVNDKLWAAPFSDQLKVEIQKRISRGENIPDIMRNALRLELSHMAEIVTGRM